MISGADFIDVAGKLAARAAAAEAEHRTAISRAYYGACHLTKMFVETLGVEVKRSFHDLPRWLSVNDNPIAKRAGQKLKDLQTQRIRADYDIDKDLAKHGADPLQHVRLCVANASDVQSLLTQCSQEPARSEVKISLERFLRSDPKRTGLGGPSSN